MMVFHVSFKGGGKQSHTRIFYLFFTNYIFFLNLLVLFFQIDLKGTNCFKWHCDGDIPVYSKYFYVN